MGTQSLLFFSISFGLEKAPGVSGQAPGTQALGIPRMAGAPLAADSVFTVEQALAALEPCLLIPWPSPPAAAPAPPPVVNDQSG